MLDILRPIRSIWKYLLSKLGAKDPSPQLPSLVSREHGKKIVLFVHGLSGSANGTWGDMLNAFSSDLELVDYAYACYSYPTSLLRIPFTKRMGGIQEIASGLRTHIETHFEDKTGIILVGHSLGGVVARQYILDEIKSQRTGRIRGVALFATPHTGAALASIGNSLSKSHRHLAQLCHGSDILDIINSDWVKLKIEDQVSALYIVGGGDAVVPRDSAAPYLGADNVRTLIQHGHIDIVKPKDSHDTRFMLLRGFILKTMPLENFSPTNKDSLSKTNGDVLFDFYTASVESFYIKRVADTVLLNATKSAHAWVSGPPGLGKTASLKRLVDISGWQLHHVILDSYKGLGAYELIREVCNILCEHAKIEPNSISRTINREDLFACFRRALSRLSKEGPIAILVEEIPLPCGEEYTAFLDLVYQLTLSSENTGSSGSAIWLFSSIRSPRSDVRPGSPKFWERIQVLELNMWEREDLESLIDLISRELKITLSLDDREQLLVRSKGSPRFVKMLFRRKRNEVASNISFNELLASVEIDLA